MGLWKSDVFNTYRLFILASENASYEKNCNYLWNNRIIRWTIQPYSGAEHITPRTAHHAHHTSYSAPRTSHLVQPTAHITPRTLHLALHTRWLAKLLWDRHQTRTQVWLSFSCSAFHCYRRHNHIFLCIVTSICSDAITQHNICTYSCIWTTHDLKLRSWTPEEQCELCCVQTLDEAITLNQVYTIQDRT